MAQRTNENTEDRRVTHETELALHVAWLVSLARAFPTQGGRELRRDPDIRTAQVALVRALLLAGADGTPLEELRARFIDPVVRGAGGYEEKDSLLIETVELVERHLACRT